MNDWYIYPKVPCKHGHTWNYSASVTSPDAQPTPLMRCECGMYQWQDRDNLVTITTQAKPIHEVNDGLL